MLGCCKDACWHTIQTGVFYSLLTSASALVSGTDFSVFTPWDSFSILLLYLFLNFFLFLEGGCGLDTSSQEISEKVSVQTNRASGVTRSGPRYSVLQELWQSVSPTKRDQQNQMPPLSPDTLLNKKILSRDSLCEFYRVWRNHCFGEHLCFYTRTSKMSIFKRF